MVHGWGAAVTAALPLRPRHGAVRGFAVAGGQAQELAARGIHRQGSGGPRHSAQEDYILERRLLLGRAARAGGLHQGVEPGDHMCDHHQQAEERQGRLSCSDTDYEEEENNPDGPEIPVNASGTLTDVATISDDQVEAVFD